MFSTPGAIVFLLYASGASSIVVQSTSGSGTVDSGASTKAQMLDTVQGRGNGITNGICDVFYTFDDFSPDDLPATWGGARNSFRESCASDDAPSCLAGEAAIFGGYPSGHEKFAMDAYFCERLQSVMKDLGEAADYNDREVALSTRKETKFLKQIQSKKAVGFVNGQQRIKDILRKQQ